MQTSPILFPTSHHRLTGLEFLWNANSFWNWYEMVLEKWCIVCLCLAMGAVAFNGEPVNLVEAREDFSCDEKGYVEYLSKWSVAQKSTSRDVNSEEFQTRLGYFIESCEKIHEWNKMKKYQMQFTFFADWHPDEFEELTTTKQRYSGVKAPVPSITPVYNNTNYRYLMPSMDRVMEMLSWES